MAFCVCCGSLLYLNEAYLQERLPECGDLGLELVVGSKIKVPVREKRKSSKVTLKIYSLSRSSPLNGLRNLQNRMGANVVFINPIWRLFSDTFYILSCST
jgi:hypothetical protein